jgi:excisionase family DNA binding protein
MLVPEWLTIREAATYLRVNVSTIYRWCDEGRLRYYELESGGGRRFKREDLDGLLRPGGKDEAP